MSNLIAAIKALMELVLLAKQLVSLYSQAKREGWLEEGRELAKTITEAKTDEERRELVRRLSKHRHG